MTIQYDSRGGTEGEVYIPTDMGRNAFFLMSTGAQLRGPTPQDRVDIGILAYLLEFEAGTELELVEAAREYPLFGEADQPAIRGGLKRLFEEGYITTQ